MNWLLKTRELLGEEQSPNVPKFIYHETAYENAVEILKDGFKTGSDLKKGEGTSAIFFSPTVKGMKGTSYSRGNGKRVRVEVSTNGLRLLNLDSLDIGKDELRSFEKPSYVTRKNIEVNGDFPIDYDGVYNLSYDGKSIYEIILKPSVANQKITKKIYNLKGYEIK